MERHGQRAEWTSVPTEVRSVVDMIAGAPNVRATNVAGGFSPGPAVRCDLADGKRVFVKACGERLSTHASAMHRREAAVMAAIPIAAPVPRLIGAYDDGDWVALVIELVDGRRCHRASWSSTDEEWYAVPVEICERRRSCARRLVAPQPRSADRDGVVVDRGSSRFHIAAWRPAFGQHPDRRRHHVRGRLAGRIRWRRMGRSGRTAPIAASRRRSSSCTTVRPSSARPARRSIRCRRVPVRDLRLFHVQVAASASPWSADAATVPGCSSGDQPRVARRAHRLALILQTSILRISWSE